MPTMHFHHQTNATRELLSPQNPAVAGLVYFWSSKNTQSKQHQQTQANPSYIERVLMSRVEALLVVCCVLHVQACAHTLWIGVNTSDRHAFISTVFVHI